jgi:sulfate adenylyltransferase (ADP) / ATP adenylyltransferase
MFYNCGLDGGSSQPHKHMQLIAKPTREEFVLFPDLESEGEAGREASGSDGLTFSTPPPSSHVPYYALVSYPKDDTKPSAIHNVYQRMLASPHPDYPDLSAHNVIMTTKWLCVIPRKKRLMLGVPANAMGMMGLIWVGTWSERMGWTLMGKTWHLETLGCPPLKT